MGLTATVKLPLQTLTSFRNLRIGDAFLIGEDDIGIKIGDADYLCYPQSPNPMKPHQKPFVVHNSLSDHAVFQAKAMRISIDLV